MSIPTTQCYF